MLVLALWSLSRFSTVSSLAFDTPHTNIAPARAHSSGGPFCAPTPLFTAPPALFGPNIRRIPKKITIFAR